MYIEKLPPQIILGHLQQILQMRLKNGVDKQECIEKLLLDGEEFLQKLPLVWYLQLAQQFTYIHLLTLMVQIMV